jgi:hypothetical protein
LEFAKLCKERGGNVVLSVVDVLSESDIEKCQRIAEKLGVSFRVRAKQ